jgi:hypothetical protein
MNASTSFTMWILVCLLPLPMNKISMREKSYK